MKAMQWTVAGLLAVAAAGGVFGQSEQEQGGGEGRGPWILSPQVNVVGVYDSNVDRASSGGADDFFLTTGLGLRALYLVPDFTINGLGFAFQRSYAEASENDFSSAGQVLTLRYGATDAFIVEAYQSFRRVEDTDVYGTEIVGSIASDTFLDADARGRRDVTEAGVSLGAPLGDRHDIQTGYRFNHTKDRSGNLLDITTHGAQVEASQSITDRSAGLITVLSGLQESESVDDWGVYTAASLGVTTRRTDRVTLKAGAGLQNFDRPDVSGSVDGFYYAGQASWKTTDRTTLSVAVRNGIQLSSLYAANVVDFSTFRMSLATQMTDAFILSFSGVYRKDDYQDPVAVDGGTADREDEGVTGILRVDYLMPPNRNLRLFVETGYEVVDSTIRDYEVSRVSVGAQILL